MNIFALDPVAKEPATNTGITVGALAAIYTIINEIWPGLLSDKIQEAVTTILLILIPYIMSIIIRNKVFSPASVHALRIENKRLHDELGKTLDQ